MNLIIEFINSLTVVLRVVFKEIAVSSYEFNEGSQVEF